MVDKRLPVVADLPPGLARADGRQLHMVDGVPADLIAVRRHRLPNT
jgi:hypothetical protein